MKTQNEVLTRYIAGKRLETIAEELGISNREVIAYLREASDVQEMNFKLFPEEYSGEDGAKKLEYRILVRYVKGESLEEIAENLEISKQILYTMLRKSKKEEETFGFHIVVVGEFLKRGWDYGPLAEELNVDLEYIWWVDNKILQGSPTEYKRRLLMGSLKELAYNYKSDKEIAEDFDVSPATVKNYRDELDLEAGSKLKTQHQKNLIKLFTENSKIPMTNEEVSEVTGIDTERVIYLRKLLGLSWRDQKKEMEDRVVTLYNNVVNPTDRYLSERLGIEKETVTKIRKKYNLESPKDEFENFLEEQVIKLSKQYLTGEEISEKLGIAKSKVYYLRRKNDLPSEKKKVEEERVRKIKELIKEGYNDREIEEEIGIDRQRVGYLRRENGIMSQQERQRLIEKANDLYEIGIPKEIIDKETPVDAEYDREVRPKPKEQVKFLREKGYTDKEMAEALNMDKSKVIEIRKELGFKSVTERQKEIKHIKSLTKTAKDIRLYYDLGMTGNEIKEYLDLDTKKFEFIKNKFDIRSG